mmetsp:Transcript_46059/g.84439  ORF Transcript_46059/g.84439 Transcript_46059/m.84439 type:complete len:237 (-) Transcript_46059:38-748(-)
MLPCMWSYVIAILCWSCVRGEPWATSSLEAEPTDELFCLLQTSVHRRPTEILQGSDVNSVTASKATMEPVQLDANSSRMLELIRESGSEAMDTRVPGVTKNKWVVSLMELFGGGFFGLPRMYIGWDEPDHKNLWLGVLQLFTLGGCGVWAAVDWIAFTVNSLQTAPNMDAVSIAVSWRADTIAPARTIAIFQLIMVASLVFLTCCLGLLGAAAVAIEQMAPRSSSKRAEKQITGEI